MSKEKHSPTPWKVSEAPHETGGRWIEKANGFFIGSANTKEDADFIVEAVNAYDNPRIVTDDSKVNAALLEERDRLRDDVGWLLHFARMLMERWRGDYEKGRALGLIKPREYASAVRRMDWLDGQLAEIRAAVGEEGGDGGR